VHCPIRMHDGDALAVGQYRRDAVFVLPPQSRPTHYGSMETLRPVGPVMRGGPSMQGADESTIATSLRALLSRRGRAAAYLSWPGIRTLYFGGVCQTARGIDLGREQRGERHSVLFLSAALLTSIVSPFA
jgi:hypothetical protein